MKTKTESEFARRIAAVHAGDTKDVRHGELQAMFDTFLGRDFDLERRKQIETLQINLIQKQTDLEEALEKKQISAEEYVDFVNKLLADTFEQCEGVLGPKDFKQLFGTSAPKRGGLIDKTVFLEAEEPKVERKSYAYAAGKAARQRPAFMRPLEPDDKLSAIVGSKPLPRSELTKKLWDYIKKNGLQDKKKKTQINADDSLRAVFNGKSQVSLVEMTKLVSGHLR